MSCSVVGCINTEETVTTRLSFHKFPSKEPMSSWWKTACGLHENTILSPNKVCRIHFDKKDYTKLEAVRPRLHRGAYPTLSVPVTINIKIEDHEVDQNNGEVEDEKQQLKEEITFLNLQLNTLREKCDHLESVVKSQENVILKFSSQFPKGVKRRIFARDDNGDEDIKSPMSRLGKTQWDDEDIQWSMTLFLASSNAYRLLFQRKFPLPAVRTLQRNARAVNVDEGYLQCVVPVLQSLLAMDPQNAYSSFLYDESGRRTCMTRLPIKVR